MSPSGVSNRTSYVHFIAFAVVVISVTIMLLYESHKATGEIRKVTNPVYFDEETAESK